MNADNPFAPPRADDAWSRLEGDLALALRLVAREARRRGHGELGPEHLLAAALALPDRAFGMRQQGVDVDGLDQRVVEALAYLDGPEPLAEIPPPSQGFTWALAETHDEGGDGEAALTALLKIRGEAVPVWRRLLGRKPAPSIGELLREHGVTPINAGAAPLHTRGYGMPHRLLLHRPERPRDRVVALLRDFGVAYHGALRAVLAAEQYGVGSVVWGGIAEVEAAHKVLHGREGLVFTIEMSPSAGPPPPPR